MDQKQRTNEIKVRVMTRRLKLQNKLKELYELRDKPVYERDVSIKEIDRLIKEVYNGLKDVEDCLINLEINN